MSYTLEGLASHANNFPGFPTSKSERWRFSHLSPWLERPLENMALKRAAVDFETPYSLVIENGEMVSEHLPEGVTVGFECYEGIKHPQNPFNVLNAAYAPILCIHIGQSFEGILQVVYQYGAGLRHSRVGIHLEAGVRVQMIERFVGGSGSFITHHTAWLLQPQSTLDHTLIQDLDASAAMVSEMAFELKTDTLAQACYVANGGAYHQHFATAELGEAARMRMYALLTGHEAQRQVLCTDFNHRAPKSQSYQLSKQILYDASVAVFDGKALITTDAQGSEAIQGAHSLLLSDEAQVHAKPHLEIYTDDLKASHGATVGQLDEEAMAYLQSRGISEAMARQMMIDAFAAEVLEAIEDEALREHIATLAGRHHE